MLCMTALQAQKLSDEYQDLDERIMCLADEDIYPPTLPFGWKKCVLRIEDETLAENVVAEVFQTGFLMGERVIRFAMVKVAN